MSQPALSDELLGKIHHGDCFAGMNGLPAGSVDLVFADPPFNIGYDYDVYHDAQDYEDYLAWSRDWIGAVHRVLKPDGTFWLAIGDEYAAELKIESQKLGFHIRSWVIWYYTFGVNCKYKFSRSHAHLFHFIKDPKQFTFLSAEPENRIPSARLLVYGDARGNPDGRLPDDTWILRPQDLAGHFTPDEDTWYFPRVAGTFKERAGFHGCQMPEQLLGRIIRGCSRDGEIVLDPFSGSATTLAVAKKLCRRHIGFDLSHDYVKLGTQRLAGIRIGDLLDGAIEPTMSAPKTSQGKRTQRRSTGSLDAPLTKVLESSASAVEEWAGTAFVQGVIEALIRVRDGFSIDRLVADPNLNRRFAEECRSVGVAGDIRAWNRALFQLRKSGKLAQSPTVERTSISWERCDAFLFASEIAWREMLDSGCASLDEILCDPELAAEFDRRAAALAPDFEPLDYRWGALKLRKAAKVARVQSQHLKPARMAAPQRVAANTWSKAPSAAGVYLILNAKNQRACYVGGSLDLHARFATQFGPTARKSLKTWAPQLSLQYFMTESEASLLLAYQSLLVRKYEPRYNLLDPSLT